MPPSCWLLFNTNQPPLPCSEGRQNNCKLVANPRILIMSASEESPRKETKSVTFHATQTRWLQYNVTYR